MSTGSIRTTSCDIRSDELVRPFVEWYIFEGRCSLKYITLEPEVKKLCKCCTHEIETVLG